MPTLVACLWRRVEAIQLGRVPTHFGPATRLRRPESQWNQGALAARQGEMCPRTANSGLTYRGQMLEVEIGLEKVKYALREGECLVIRHEREEIQLTREHPLAVRSV